MVSPSDRQVRSFREQNGLDLNEEGKRIWMAQLGRLKLPLPNWHWRRSIVARHDMHHIVSGYDTSARGELMVASWELGARAYYDWRARALCLFLMVLGLIRYPRAAITAFTKGEQSRFEAEATALEKVA